MKRELRDGYRIEVKEDTPNRSSMCLMCFFIFAEFLSEQASVHTCMVWRPKKSKRQDWCVMCQAFGVPGHQHLRILLLDSPI
jgi:hypothetical protein